MEARAPPDHVITASGDERVLMPLNYDQLSRAARRACVRSTNGPDL